jgi:hypothetical protein
VLKGVHEKTITSENLKATLNVVFIGINVGDVVVGYPRQLSESLLLNFATW